MPEKWSFEEAEVELAGSVLSFALLCWSQARAGVSGSNSRSLEPVVHHEALLGAC